MGDHHHLGVIKATPEMARPDRREIPPGHRCGKKGWLAIWV